MKTQDLVNETNMISQTRDPNPHAGTTNLTVGMDTAAGALPDPKKILKADAKRALPKGMMTKEERKDFFNKKQPESSPLYKISKAESKTESNDPKLIGAGFATRKDLISAANAGMKNLVNVANSPQDDALKF